MAEYIDRKEEVEIPRGSGIEGFMTTLRKILELPRVQYVHIERGKIAYARSVRPEEPRAPLGIDFVSLMPATVIRGSELHEENEEENAAKAVCVLLRRAGIMHQHPIAFASGTKTHFWEWHRRTTGIDLKDRSDQIYGLPFLLDEQLPNESLLLCTGFSKGAALVDTRLTFKMSMPLGMEVTP
jgi:hypothetical protein